MQSLAAGTAEKNFKWGQSLQWRAMTNHEVRGIWEIASQKMAYTAFSGEYDNLRF